MVLTSSQFRVLQAAMDRIVPADQNLGAWDAGCGEFLTALLQDGLVDFELYSRGLDSLEAESQSVYQRAFDEITPDERDEILSAVEVSSVVTPWLVPPAQFFRTLVKNTMEGYYGNPANGGLRQSQAWAMVGFEVTG